MRPRGYEVPIMRAVVCESLDGLQSLKLGQMPEPAASAGQILVDVHAASVSFMDCLMVAGKYQMRPQTPFVPGTDAAGVVTAVGEGVTRFKPGDRVACGSWFGAYAEKMAAPQGWAARLPPAVDYVAGSAVRHGSGPAYYGLVVSARLRPGETVFVTGAGGGVGPQRLPSGRAKTKSVGVPFEPNQNPLRPEVVATYCRPPTA